MSKKLIYSRVAATAILAVMALQSSVVFRPRPALGEAPQGAPRPARPEVALDLSGRDLGGRAPVQRAMAVGPAVASAPSSPIASIAEALQIRFQQYTEISGIYRLSENETISVPGLGRIELGEMTAGELELVLARRLNALTGREVSVAVEVERYRQVFVSGDVEQPGSFNWFRGMTVLKAISLAGGSARLAEIRAEASSVADVTESKLSRALSRHARLMAELNGKVKIVLPERLVELVGESRARQLIDAEERLLVMRTNSRDAAVKVLDATQVATKAELGRLKELQVAIETRMKTKELLARQAQAAYEKRIVVQSRVFDAEGAISDLTEKMASTRVQLARALASEQQLARERLLLDDSLRATLTEELGEIGARIEELEADYRVVKKHLAPSDAVAPKAAQYEIARRVGDIEVKRPVGELEVLRPGETLIVTREDSGQSDRLAPASGGRNSGQTTGRGTSRKKS